MLRQVFFHLPNTVQYLARRTRDALEIRRGAFATEEPELRILPQILSAGDWVLDIGANIGHYTIPLSRIVGESGRVIAFEPVLSTFAHLAANVRYAGCRNVTLVNAAASERSAMVGMSMPAWPGSTRENPYQAQISDYANAPVSAMAICVDALCLPAPVALAKVDVEGHEMATLRGMRQLLERDRPILIVEGDEPEIVDLLQELTYTPRRLRGSPNAIFLADTESGRRAASAAGI